MKTKWVVLLLLVLCGFLVVLYFGIPAPGILNHAYTGVVANIIENDGSLSVSNAELAPEAATNVLAAIQSHRYARRFPDGSAMSPGPVRMLILSLVYEEAGAEKHDLFAINSAGAITIDTFNTSGGYRFLLRNEKAQQQLFQTIYSAIPK